MINFQTEQLRTFLAVLEKGTFDAAARQLHVSASAVSQRIKAMEQGAGQLLLQRTTPIRPTPAGSVVHKLARQLRQLEWDATAELDLQQNSQNTITVAVNADSLATWFMDALAGLPAGGELALELLREDEQHSAQLLRTGTVMAAVTATATPIQGCTSMHLGAMEYRPVAAAGFMERWFPKGFSAQDLPQAPAISFDRGDTLQSNFFTAVTGDGMRERQHYIPDTLQFADAVKLGLGWGLLPQAHCRQELERGDLVELIPDHVASIQLYWQRWKIESNALELLTKAVAQAAAAALAQR